MDALFYGTVIFLGFAAGFTTRGLLWPACSHEEAATYIKNTMKTALKEAAEEYEEDEDCSAAEDEVIQRELEEEAKRNLPESVDEPKKLKHYVENNL